jgi:hypothetical protein
MKTIQLSGRITERGELELRLPEGLPPGEARITIEIPQPDDWRPEDVESALKVEPLTGAEIVQAGLLGGWEDQGISDSDAWLEEQRRRRRGQRPW